VTNSSSSNSFECWKTVERA